MFFINKAIYIRSVYKPGLNVIVKNNTNNYINDACFTIAHPTVEELNDGLKIKIKPHSITKGHHKFKYLESTAMYYKNNLLEFVPLPVAYVNNHEGIIVVIVIINNIDDSGNIIDYKVLNSTDYSNRLFVNSIILEVQYFFYNLTCGARE